MTKLPALSLLAITSLSLAGCGMTGGPSDADIAAVAKSQMLENLGTDDPAAKAKMQAVAEAATVEPKGMCNNYEGEKYACGVDVTTTMPGAAAPATTTMVVQLTKGADGKWVAAD
jgi:hypothetical protein